MALQAMQSKREELNGAAFLSRDPAATMHVGMARTVYILCLGLLIVALFGFGPDEAWGKPGGSPRRLAEVSAHPLDGPAGVYAKIPARDEYGRDQLAMFRAWNPDPVGH